MNMKQLKELMALFEKHGLTRLEIAEGETKIFLAREGLVMAPPPAPAPVAEASAAPKKADPGPDFSQLHEVKSPMVGVFYAAPEPGAQPFVKVGDRVEKGDVLCLVEAMKLHNEIVADRAGEIVDVCVQNGGVVEFGQALFKLF